MNKVFITLLLLISLPVIAMDDVIDDPELVQAYNVAEKRAAKLVALSTIATKLDAMYIQLSSNPSICPEKMKQAIAMINSTAITFNNIKLITFTLERYPRKENELAADAAIYNFTLQEPYLNAAIANILTPTSDDIAAALSALSLGNTNNSTGNGLCDSDLVYN